MARIDAVRRVDASLGSGEPSSSSGAPVKAPVVQNFEWVQHGDATARRRARAHVTRGFRRKKAEDALLAKLKRDSESLSPTSDLDEAIAWSELPVAQPYKEPKVQSTMVVRTLGSGRTDPFSTLPLKLDASAHALLDHFVFGVAPVSFNHDSTSNFNPVKALSFKISKEDVSALHVILSVGASDIAALHGRHDSEDAIKHKALSISIMNKRLSAGNSSDNSLGTVSLLAGMELLFGTPQGFCMHMKGLAELVRLRGGLETFQHTNPNLYAWLSWIDYAGSCNLVGRRKFDVIGPVANPLASNPVGVPGELLNSVPAGYDLFRHITKTFQRCEDLIKIGQSSRTSFDRACAVLTSLGVFDKSLYQSICRPDTTGNRSRRQYIEQTMYIMILMLGAVLSSNDGAELVFLRKVNAVLVDEAKMFGVLVAELSRMCNSHIDSNILESRISMLVDTFEVMGWDTSRRTKVQLLHFFLTDDVCAGNLQTLWRGRMENIWGVKLGVLRLEDQIRLEI